MRPQIESASSWTLVGFLTVEPQWELPKELIKRNRLEYFETKLMVTKGETLRKEMDWEAGVDINTTTRYGMDE